MQNPSINISVRAYFIQAHEDAVDEFQWEAYGAAWFEDRQIAFDNASKALQDLAVEFNACTSLTRAQK